MDIQIIILLLLANIVMNSGREKMSLSIICLTSLFKFYTSPILLLACFFVKRRSSRIYGLFISFLTSIVILYQMIKTPLTPFIDGAQNKFGAQIFDNYARKAGFDLSNFQGEIIGLFTLFLAFFLIIYCYKKFSLERTSYPTRSSSRLDILYVNFIFMAGTSVILYVTALNVDYKLTFIALAGIALSQLPQIRIRYISDVFPYVWLISLWFTFPLASLSKYIHVDLQPVGDLAMVVTMAYFMFQIIIVVKHVYKRV